MSTKTNWLQRQEAKWQQEFAPRLAELRQQLTQEERQLKETLVQQQTLRREAEQALQDVSDLQRRQLDRKEELAKSNEELRQQVRLIEAKAKPDAVWLTAFQSGYEKAWETMMPLLQQGISKTAETLRQDALSVALKTVEPAIEQRVRQQVEDFSRFQTLKSLQAKRSELNAKRLAAPITDQPRYEHYLEALSWVLDGNAARSG